MAGITYDFRTVTTGLQGTDQRVHASVEGANVRLDFETGDGMLFRNGAVAVSHDGGTKLTVLDPQAKTFFDIDLSSLNAGEMANMFKLSNEKVSVKDAGDGGVMEGYPTQRKTVTAGADVVIGNAMSMHFEVTMESWSTAKIPMEAAGFLQRRTGNTGLPMLDKLIAAQSNAVKGFPLKQITTVKVMKGGKTTLEMSSTTTVSNVKQKTVPAASFVVPAGYRRVASPIDRLMK